MGVSELSDNCAPDTQAYLDAIIELLATGEWDVFSGVKLSYTKNDDGSVTITQTDSALKTNDGKEIVPAGGKSVEDSVITGTMNYFVEGVQVG